MNNKRPQHGFSLVEVIISTSILLILVVFTYDFVKTGFGATRFNNQQAEAVENARRAMNMITRDIKEAKHSEGTDLAIKVSDPQDIVFYADYDNDDDIERIRHVLEGSKILRITTEPGPSSDYTGTQATTTVASYINNNLEPLFIYFDSDGNSTNIEHEVRRVRITLKVNVDPSIAPGDFFVESDITLRNLKDN